MSILKNTFPVIFLLLLNFACSNKAKSYIQEVKINNSKLDSIIDYALKEEINFYNPTSLCGLMRFSKINEVFQIEVVITDKNSFDEVDSKFFPEYFFYYKDFPIFIINKTVDNKFFRKTENKKHFEYPKINNKAIPHISSKLPPKPPSNFEPTVFFFYYFDGRIFFQRKDTFMFDQFVPI